MKIGDTVILKDGSYSMSIRFVDYSRQNDNHKIEHRTPAIDGTRQWILLATNVTQIPTEQKNYYIPENNCILVDVAFSEIVFTQTRFIKPIVSDKVAVTVEGNTKYISRESAKTLNLI